MSKSKSRRRRRKNRAMLVTILTFALLGTVLILIIVILSQSASGSKTAPAMSTLENRLPTEAPVNTFTGGVRGRELSTESSLPRTFSVTDFLLFAA